MAIITDYQSLQDTVARYLIRETDTVFVEEIPTFIRNAEEQMFVDLRAREMICRFQAILNEEFEWLPESFLEMYSVSLLKTRDSGTTFVDEIPLVFQDIPVFLKRAREHSSGDPCFYTVYGEQIRFAPVPTVAADGTRQDWFEMVAYARFAQLGTTNAQTGEEIVSNAILANYSSLYLYASLIQSHAFQMDHPKMKDWIAIYADSVQKANRLSRSRRHGPMALPMPV